MIKPSCMVWFGVVLSVGAPVCRAQQSLPDFRVAPWMVAEGSWTRAESVVVGDISNIKLMAYQQVASLPAPLPASVHEIRWCEADFHAVAMIKGKMPDPLKKYVWATIQQDCRLGGVFGYTGSEPPVTRVWFLREEDEYLRPSVDAGGVYYASFHVDWRNVPASEAAGTFARLLVDPAALGFASEQQDRLFEMIEVSRAILGQEKFVAQLKAVAARHPGTTLDKSIRGYLDAEFGAKR
jgi:hypothetical protein